MCYLEEEVDQLEVVWLLAEVALQHLVNEHLKAHTVMHLARMAPPLTHCHLPNHSHILSRNSQATSTKKESLMAIF